MNRIRQPLLVADFFRPMAIVRVRVRVRVTVTVKVRDSITVGVSVGHRAVVRVLTRVRPRSCQRGYSTGPRYS